MSVKTMPFLLQKLPSPAWFSLKGVEKKKLLPATMQALDFEGGC
jgi:hypothetical protein